MDYDTRRILEEDKRKHPKCNYSESYSKSCSTTNGKFVCETIKNIQRMCPGERPATVVSKRTVSDSNEDDDGMSFPKVSLPKLFGGLLFGGDPVSAIEGMMKEFGGLDSDDRATRGPFGNGGGFRGFEPPHARINNNDDEEIERLFGGNRRFDNNHEPQVRGEIVGSIEEI